MIKTLPFYDHITSLGGSIYQVGGAVRDKILGRKSKDLDLLVTGIPLYVLAIELSRFGKVSEVGESFGIIKLVIDGEELDIAIPRTERKTSAGHQGFEVNADHTIPIETDLWRRDFTMNAIAEDADGNIIDPFGGLEDIRNMKVKAVNPDAFIDDPLRMLRAIQFCVRFGFTLDGDTYLMFLDNDNWRLLKEISPERILMEFEKIVKAGPDACHMAQDLMYKTRLYLAIFNRWKGGANCIPSKQTIHPENMGEFVFMLLQNTIHQHEADVFYKKTLKGDIDTTKYIKAFAMLYKETGDMQTARYIAYEAAKTSRTALGSNNLFGFIREAVNEFNAGLYPSSLKELAINGDDLIGIGYSGREIGEILLKCLVEIYGDTLKNNREEIMSFINENCKRKESS